MFPTGTPSSNIGTPNSASVQWKRHEPGRRGTGFGITARKIRERFLR
jgi:hypothetical protein